MNGKKYSSAHLRRATKPNADGFKPWRGVLSYSIDNPEHVPAPEGDDTRTKQQRTGKIWKEKTKTFPATVRTKSQANRALSEWWDEMEREAANARPRMTVADYVDRFLDSHPVEDSTMAGYRNTAAHIRARFADTPLDALTGKMVSEWLASPGVKRYSLSMQGKFYRLLHLVCKHAVMDEDMDSNPCDRVKPPRAPKPDPNALVNDAPTRAVETLRAMEPTPLVTGALLALTMGLRIGEACGLRWTDVDFHDGTLTVCNAIGRADGKTYEKTPKNDGSIRTLPLTPQAVEALTKRKQFMVDELVNAGLKPDAIGGLFVLGRIDGAYQSPSPLSKQWKALASAMNLKGSKGRILTFHNLRDTFATVAVKSGADIKATSSFLGHSNAAMTLNVYADADPEAKRTAAVKVGTALSA